MKSSYRAFRIVCISFLFWTAIFELSATFWVRKFGDPLDKAKEVLDIDSSIGWRQKVNFRGKFLNIPLITNELGLRDKPLSKIANAAKKILFLGPSSTFGWGVGYGETYSANLEKLLRSEYPDQDIKVLNGGQIGFSTWQGLQFYRKELLENIHFDIIVVAYGINDVDKFRFYYNSPLSDKDEFATPKTHWKSVLQNAMNNLNFVNFFSRMASKALHIVRCGQRNVPVRRVDNSDFIRNIGEYIKLGRKLGSDIILLASPYALPSFDEIDRDQEIISRDAFKLGKIKYYEQDYEQALHYFNESVKLRPDQNEVYYYMSACYAMIGECRQSHVMYKRARSTEPKRIEEDISALNNLLADIAKKENVFLIETITGVMYTENNKYFVDPIHLSRLGNEIVAKKIYSVILRKGLIDQKRGNLNVPQQ